MINDPVMTTTETVDLGVLEWSQLAQRLVMSDDSSEISKLENHLGINRGAAVVHFITHSCCSTDLDKSIVSGNCTSKQRLDALRALIRGYQGAGDNG